MIAKNRTQHSFILSVYFLVFLILALGACGKRSNPRPPEEIAPAQVVAPAAVTEVDAVILSWQAPKETQSGDDLENLADFVIERSLYLEDERADFEEIGEVLSSEPTQPTPEPVVYNFRDENVEVGKVYEYRILPRNFDGLTGISARPMRVTFLGESSIIR